MGDWAILDGPRLTAVLPRWLSLDRQARETGAVQVLAANVDLVLVTVPADRPSMAQVEREVLLAWESGARPVVVITKADLAPSSLVDDLTGRIVGVDVVVTSTPTETGVAEVAALCAPDRTAVLLGPSGAGKSSLTNALLRKHHQTTGAVRGEAASTTMSPTAPSSPPWPRVASPVND